jgi:hypothetical protein
LEGEKVKFKVIGILFFAMLISSIGCTGPGGTAVATTTTEIPGPPSQEELAAQDFKHPELPRITSEQLKNMMDNGETLLLVDTRDELMFNLGHLPETINITLEPEDKQTARFLSLPKDRTIIFYCD